MGREFLYKGEQKESGMVKALLLIPLFVSCAWGEQVSSQYKRERIKYQFLMNEVSGTDAIDTSTHNIPATSLGTGNAIVIGKHGYAKSMNGSGCLQISSTASARAPDNIYRNFTIEVSFRYRTNTVPRANIIGQSGSGGDSWWIAVNASKLHIDWDGNPDDAIADQISIPIQSGTWYQAIYTRKAGELKKGYLNGVLVSSSATGSSQLNLDQDINIGCGNNGTVVLLDGDVDEVTIWDEEFTEAEVKELFNTWSGKQRRSFSPFQYYP